MENTGSTAKEKWFVLKFVVSESQAMVIREALDRVIAEAPLSGKNLRGRALELIAADSLSAPSGSFTQYES